MVNGGCGGCGGKWWLWWQVVVVAASGKDRDQSLTAGCRVV